MNTLYRMPFVQRITCKRKANDMIINHAYDIDATGKVTGFIEVTFTVRAKAGAPEHEVTCKFTIDDFVAAIVEGPALDSAVIRAQSAWRRAATREKDPVFDKMMTMDLVPNVTRKAVAIEYIPVSEYRARHKELEKISDEVLIFMVNEQTKPKGWRLVAG